MTQPTINQLNGRLRNNQTIKFYNSIGFWSTDYRNRRFNFKRSDCVDSLSIAGNYLYGAAVRQFELAAGVKGYDWDRDTKRCYFELSFFDRVLQFQVRCEQSMNGVNIRSIETNFKPLKNWGSAYIIVKSNSTFAEFNLEDHFKKRILPKYLFAPGKFQNIQIFYNISKKDAIEKWKEINGRNPIDFEDRDDKILTGLKRLLLIRKNIWCADDVRPGKLRKVLSEFPYQKKRKKLFNHPSILEMSDRYSSQYDTDDSFEEFVDDIYNDYPKNSIFI